MNLFLAVEYSDSLIEGYSEQVRGVFDSEQNAMYRLSELPLFDQCKTDFKTNSKKYVMDSELTVGFFVRKVKLNESL